MVAQAEMALEATTRQAVVAHRQVAVAHRQVAVAHRQAEAAHRQAEAAHRQVVRHPTHHLGQMTL